MPNPLAMLRPLGYIKKPPGNLVDAAYFIAACCDAKGNVSGQKINSLLKRFLT